MKFNLIRVLSAVLVAVFGLAGCLADTSPTDAEPGAMGLDPAAEGAPVDTLSGAIPADEEHQADEMEAPAGAPPLPDVVGPDAPSAGSSDVNASCGQIEACLQACETEDEGCRSACVDAGDAAARAAHDALRDCIQRHACEDAQCVEEACGTVLDVCHQRVTQGSTSTPAAEGTATCPEIFACFDRCPDGDDACLRDCYAEGSEEARRGVDGVGACIDENQCADVACFEAHCGAAVRVCEQGSAPAEEAAAVDAPSPPGAAHCTEIIGCLRRCETEACADGCVAAGTESGRATLGALSACIAEHQCDSNGCVEDRCGLEVAACVEDGAAPGRAREDAPLSCVEVYQCSVECARDDGPCHEACYAQGSERAQAEVDAVAACVRAHGCRDDACAHAECGAEIDACERPDDDSVEPELDEEDDEPGAGQQRLWNRGRARAAAQAGTCESPTELPLGLTLGTTRDAPQEMHGECGGHGGERVYRLAVGHEMAVCLDTFGSEIDTVLYVHEGRCGAAADEILCNDDAEGLQSRLTLVADADTEYFVVVDSFGDGGDFTLEVTEGPCP